MAVGWVMLRGIGLVSVELKQGAWHSGLNGFVIRASQKRFT